MPNVFPDDILARIRALQAEVDALTVVVEAGSSSSGASPLTTKGDLFTYSTVDDRLGVGADATLFQADSAQSTGNRWAALSGDATIATGGALTFATVNSNVGTFGDATDAVTVTADGKGRITAISQTAISGLVNATYGDGSDGTLTYDGSTTILGVAPAASVYTLTRDIFPQTMTINSGVTVKTGGFRIYVRGTLTIQSTGVLSRAGNNSVAGAAGAALNSATTGSSGAGAAGAASGSGGSPGGNTANSNGGSGGAGGTTPTPRAAGPGGTATAPTATQGTLRANPASLAGVLISANGSSSTTTLQIVNGGAGGGSGGCDASSTSGGGGSGGGILILAAAAISNSGSISARGGNGSNATGTRAGGGGGGGGGCIVITTNSTTVGTTDVTGGTHGTQIGGGTDGADGSAGTLISIHG